MNSTAPVTSGLSARPNTTETIIIEGGDVETLSIIVWAMGGVLLVSLLALLGRIILARNKLPVHLEYLDQNAYRNTAFRIPISTQPCNSRNGGSLSRDTAELVSCSDSAVTDSPVAQRSSAGNNTHRPAATSPCSQNSNETRQTNIRSGQNSNQRHSSVPVYSAPPPQIATADAHGRVATINGYVIRPPSYQDVVSPSNGIPSVIVSRPIYIPRFSL